jgi:hypothetical protein
MAKTRNSKPHTHRPLNVTIRGGSRAARAIQAVAALPGNVQRVPADLAGGLSPHPEEDLVFHGGKTIRNLTFTNFYIGGDAAWQGDDRKNIDRALSAAMADPHLNNVIRQYFDNQQIAATFKPSAVLPGSKPAKFSQGDVEALVRRLRTSGALNAFALDSTVFNFILPRGTILTTDEKISGARLKINAAAANPVHPENEENSLQGLGGYHGSVHFPSLHVTVYYAISVFSEGVASRLSTSPGKTSWLRCTTSCRRRVLIPMWKTPSKPAIRREARSSSVGSRRAAMRSAISR